MNMNKTLPSSTAPMGEVVLTIAPDPVLKELLVDVEHLWRITVVSFAIVDIAWVCQQRKIDPKSRALADSFLRIIALELLSWFAWFH